MNGFLSALVTATSLVALSSPLAAQPTRSELARWQREAQNVTIIRDDWGIAHVYGHSDADAVFGMIYAQAEDDFNRVETNYINAIGRLAEAEGADEIWRDLRMKLFIDPDSMKAMYARSPRWLQSLMVAWADGLNFYLYKHPDVTPRVIHHFEPWMALTFSEGSIGGDIERVNLRDLRAFYDSLPPSASAATHTSLAPRTTPPPEPSGSNGIAIAPSNTLDHHALLLINPHTSFFFRSELQMVSDSGLNAYGAVTWGQFFVYQGFSDRAGWMHTSSGVDAIDEYAETVTRHGNRYTYRYGTADEPVVEKRITVPYRTEHGMAHRTFTAFYTRHGPVVRAENGKWITIRLMQEPVKALTQSYLRTKARNYDEFARTMELHTNSSNNTIYADADGTIAYFHGNFIPRRDTSFDWTQPVDGSDPRTDWHGVLSLDETPHLHNPPNGWLYNSNNWPWSAAGKYSPRRADFPKYVEQGRESFRGMHAIRVLQGRHDFTMQSLMDAAYDSYLPGFEVLLPPLIRAWDELPPTDSLSAMLAEQIGELRRWDYRWGVSSVPTSLAVFWGTEAFRALRGDAARAGMPVDEYIVERAPGRVLLEALARASDRLTADFGSWRTPWGEINRFQRINDDIESSFDDSKPSIPVGFTSSLWGSLASFGARPYPNTKRWYGTSGNSFVAVVEFGDSVRAVAVTAGGESGHPDSPHFNDEAERYATGKLRPVYYYRSQLQGHTEREYHPGS
ncbi:MAG TPA: penicillin acylase family protein [Gemmatimonadaceae bacterium]|nr:penicillin acylase family protein [Gemmatimonadaceae bacterium]